MHLLLQLIFLLAYFEASRGGSLDERTCLIRSVPLCTTHRPIAKPVWSPTSVSALLLQAQFDVFRNVGRRLRRMKWKYASASPPHSFEGYEGGGQMSTLLAGLGFERTRSSAL